MDNNKKPNAIEYNVPSELFADILRILMNNKISYKIIGVRSRTNIILLNVKYDTNSKIQNEIRENIQSLLLDFTYYMEGLSEAVIYEEVTE